MFHWNWKGPPLLFTICRDRLLPSFLTVYAFVDNIWMGYDITVWFQGNMSVVWPHVYYNKFTQCHKSGCLMFAGMKWLL